MIIKWSAPLEHSKPPTVTFSIAVKAPIILAVLSNRQAERTPLPTSFSICWPPWPPPLLSISSGKELAFKKTTCTSQNKLIENIISNLLFFNFLIYLFIFGDRVSLCSWLELCILSWPWTHRNLLASTFQMLGLKSCTLHTAILYVLILIFCSAGDWT